MTTYEIVRQPLDGRGRPDWSGTLDWGVGAVIRGSGLRYGDKPCKLCGRPAICISPPSKRHPFGQHCHKTCAEQWTREHPTAEVPRAATL